MKRLPVLIALSLCSVNSHSVFADTEFVDSVPLEVVRQFVGNPYMGQNALYSDILAAFPPFTVPADFEVLASADQGFVQRVILSSTLDEAGASTAITGAFVAEGWSQIPVNNGMPSQQTGFVSAEQPTIVPLQLCHDTHGMLSATVRNEGSKRYVHLNRNLSGGDFRPSCAEMLAQSAQGYPGMGFGRGNRLDMYAPKLIMPESSTPTRPAFMGGGGGGSSNEWESRGALTIDWEIGDIYEHFASQITEQGWVPDSDTAGAMFAGGSWTKSVDDVDLVGTLSIIKLTDNTWDMRFRFVRQGGAGNSPAIINSTVIQGVLR